MRRTPTNPPVLLTRDAFREGVFARDGGCCVFCKEPAIDAHHIVERRLFPDGGYYLENGASVCEKHHLECEMTTISVEEVRLAAGIRRIVLPPHLYDDQQIDKWGNPILANGTRLKGELFEDESVRKILERGRVLQLFTDLVKYPRTHHLPWSPGVSDDDRVVHDLSRLNGRRCVAATKMDGENTSLYRHKIHARSVDSRHHRSRDWVKQFHSTIAGDIPEGWRICGENLYAVHSIRYEDLPSYFMGFSIWDEKNRCLPWDETLDWFGLLGIEPVPVIYDGVFDEAALRALWKPADAVRCEGYVLRPADGFSYAEFKDLVLKFVRPGHVQTVKHWMHGQQMEVNGLRSRPKQEMTP